MLPFKKSTRTCLLIKKRVRALMFEGGARGVEVSGQGLVMTRPSEHSRVGEERALGTAFRPTAMYSTLSAGECARTGQRKR